jgi:hypothetical protein
MTDNPLRSYFLSNTQNLIHKWDHYFDIYHRHFARFRNQSPTVLEFGVYQGGSLHMWRDYFGAGSKIVGVDIDARCKRFDADSIRVFIGNQEDRQFLRNLGSELGELDIVIDDGGHTMAQQTVTFEETYRLVRRGGVYLVEDLHTSYWHEYGGALRSPTSFVEVAKRLVDQLNAWHSRDTASLAVDDFTRSTRSIHFYDSVVVFEKERVDQPWHRQVGQRAFSDDPSA